MKAPIYIIIVAGTIVLLWDRLQTVDLHSMLANEAHTKLSVLTHTLTKLSLSCTKCHRRCCKLNGVVIPNTLQIAASWEFARGNSRQYAICLHLDFFVISAAFCYEATRFLSCCPRLLCFWPTLSRLRKSCTSAVVFHPKRKFVKVQIKLI